MGKKKEAQEAQKAQAVAVKALEFLRKLNLDWVLGRPLEEGDIDLLRAQVAADSRGIEWASWWMEYRRADGAPVPGVSWGVSTPLTGGILILRLVEGGQVKATLKVWPSGKGLITGSEPVIRALLARPDLPKWSDEDTASLL